MQRQLNERDDFGHMMVVVNSVVSKLAFYSNDSSSTPAEVNNVFPVKSIETNEIKNEVGNGNFKNNIIFEHNYFKIFQRCRHWAFVRAVGGIRRRPVASRRASRMASGQAEAGTWRQQDGSVQRPRRASQVLEEGEIFDDVCQGETQAEDFSLNLN